MRSRIHGCIGLRLAHQKQTLNTKIANKFKRKCICTNFNTKIAKTLTAEFLDKLAVF